MPITEQQLTQIMPQARQHAGLFVSPLNEAMAAFDIATPARMAAFLAQVGHESGQLRYVYEIWGPTAAQRGYECRADLGNTQPGDGKRFMGHGLIKITGRSNHAHVRDRLRSRFGDEVPDFEACPEKLMEPRWAAMSAADFWDDRGLNELADSGNFLRITKRINGGIAGLADRQSLWAVAKNVLEVK